MLVAGGFRAYNGVNVYGIARLLPNGTRDTTFNPGQGTYNPLSLRPDGVDRFEEVERPHVVGVGQVVRQEIGPLSNDQAVQVDEPEVAARLVDAHPLLDERRRHQIRNPRRG